MRDYYPYYEVAHPLSGVLGTLNAFVNDDVPGAAEAREKLLSVHAWAERAGKFQELSQARARLAELESAIGERP